MKKRTLLSSRNWVIKISVVILTSSSAIAADKPATLIDGTVYTQPQRMVEVEPGRRLNLYCVGTGSPTVVFEAGLADPISVWGYVQPTISKDIQTCSYDRAGVAFSDAGKRASTSANIVDDLHRLLRAADIKPPYVLVGHSSGALSVRLYATTYSSEVVGMVLVDPTVEDQKEAYRALDPKKRTAEQWDIDTVEPGLSDLRECLSAAIAGFIPNSALFKKCSFDAYPQLSDAVKVANVKFEMKAKYQQTVLSETENVFSVSADQVRAARRSYGSMPLIVLTRSPSPLPKEPLTPEASLLRAVREQVVVRLHDDVAKLSTQGVNEIVPGAGHSIQLEKPQAVIEAITRVLAMAKDVKVAATQQVTTN